VIDRRGVATGGVDTETEQIDETADVTAGGVGFVEDAVLAQTTREDAEGQTDPAPADGPDGGGAAVLDATVVNVGEDQTDQLLLLEGVEDELRAQRGARGISAVEHVPPLADGDGQALSL
jgi:hypothetical protein